MSAQTTTQQASSPATQQQHFLFLQGPCGSFFYELAQKLKSQQHAVSRINFNAGDVADWQGDRAYNFTDTIDKWPHYLESFCRENHVTDILLYGDCRHYHLVAKDVAQQLGISITVFEEGYLRPNWITVEKDGVNGHSKLLATFQSSNHSAIKKRKRPPIHDCGQIRKGQVRATALHYLHQWLKSFTFKNFVSHRKVGSHFELLFWALWGLRKKKANQKADTAIQQLIDNKYDFFLFPLQLQSDAQIRFHSHHKRLRIYIDKVVASFAENADKNTLLLIKNHPLDSHLVNLKKLCLDTAKKYGITKRVIFIDGGNLPLILDNAQGVVTINSTVGMQSLHHKCPTIALGQAVYAFEGLTFQGELDDFWTQAQAPNPALYGQFYRFLLHHCQINGSYYTPEGRSFAINSPRLLELLT